MSWIVESLSYKFPELHSFAINDLVSVASVASADSLFDLFHNPLSVQAYSQLNELQTVMPDISSSAKDCWISNGSDLRYSSIQMYSALMGTNKSHLLFQNM